MARALRILTTREGWQAQLERLPKEVGVNLYEALGGEPFFEGLVERFYAGVAEDPRLRPLYPEGDLAPAARRLKLFFMQYFGGPTTYSEERGHPRLRQRHLAFSIGVGERDAWLQHMRASLDQAQIREDLDAELWAYCVKVADFLRNQDVPGS